MMGFPEVADVARKFSVMVRVQGPDPKGLKIRNHAFHIYNCGKTVLSASGMILPASTGCDTVGSNSADRSSTSAFVLTTSSMFEPFLLQQFRENISKTSPVALLSLQRKPQFISGVQIDILFEEKCGIEGSMEALSWIPAELLMLVSVPESSAAVESIVSSSFGSVSNIWEAGWSLASNSHAPEHNSEDIRTKSLWPLKNTESQDANRIGQLTTRIAVLAVSAKLSKFSSKLQMAVPRRGDLILAMGSPFGILSPLHFYNSISVGSIGNTYPPNSFTRSLLIVDIRCLPGMEGSPVFSEDGHFIGILTRPLRQKVSGAEIQMVIPWEAIASVWAEFLDHSCISSNGVDYGIRKLHALNCSTVCHLGETCSLHEQICSSSRIPAFVEKAMNSICLIKTETGSWASGVLINKEGLILTNAHILEPWRFGKTAPYSDRYEGKSWIDSICNIHQGIEKLDCAKLSLNEQLRNLEVVDGSLRHEKASFLFNSTSIYHRDIVVRLDFMKPWMWSDVKVVYISKGPLDVALLQLKVLPDQLCPISIDFKCPKVGSRAYVIGHGLFGPRCDMLPSAYFGVITRVIEATRSSETISHKSRFQDRFPVMLQTTAAVHPGSSGGAVVTSEGHLIGLVTSNAKHGGGTVIPHMNFSIPCAALEPVFTFCKDMEDLTILEQLNKPDEQLSSVWSLMPPPPHLKPHNGPDVVPEDKAKGIKASRFAKFIADQNELLKMRRQNGPDANPSILPRSKL